MLVLKDFWRTICNKTLEGSEFLMWGPSALVATALHEAAESSEECQGA